MTDSTIQNFRFFSDSLDILIVAIIFFYVLKAIEGTRSSADSGRTRGDGGSLLCLKEMGFFHA